jgi:uncharacterized protein
MGFPGKTEVAVTVAMTIAMSASRCAEAPTRRIGPRSCAFAIFAAAVFGATVQAQAQESKPAPEARIVVVGEGSVSVAPDYARIRSGVATRAKTAKEAADANSKLMAALTAALLSAGIEQNDIQTSRFSVQPVYASPAPNTEQRLTGFSVSNQVSVTVRQIDKVGDLLDRLITAGATDAGSVEFLHTDSSKTLDRAREAAMADARRKAELYAHAAGLSLGGVAWITEDSSYAPPMAKVAMHAPAPIGAPIAAGEDTLQARITVGYDIAR